MIDALLYIYPDLNLESTVIVKDDGDGIQYIASWNDPRPQPSVAELTAAQLPAIKAKKITELKAACKYAIESGFTSNALGADHTYDSQLPQDQINLLGAKTGGVDLYFTCTDINGVKAERWHTYTQISAVFNAGTLHVKAQKSQFWSRVAVVMAATTESEVIAVVW